MAKINEYPLERFTFGDDDYYDIDYWDGAVYQSAKIKGSTIKAAMSGGGSILAADGQVMPADRSQDLASFKLSLRDGVFTLGTVDADFGSIFQATKDSGNTYATIKTKTNDNAALILDINTADVTGAGNKTAFIQFRDAGVSKYIFGTNTDGVANFSDNSFFISSSAQLTDYIQAIDRDTESFVIGRQVGNPLNDNTKFLINNGNSFDTTELDNVLVLSSRDETKKWLVDKDMVMSHTKAQSLELTSTDRGLLLNRVTTAQMNGIASPTTNEIVYNTDFNGLYRYDGSNWVALSSGYGIIEVVNDGSNGVPVYFSDLQTALETCKTGNNTVTLYSNITINSAITIKQGGAGTGGAYQYESLTIDFNGFKVINDEADGSNAFDVQLNTSTSGNQQISFINGQVIRTSGTGTHYALYMDYASTYGSVTMSNMVWYCENSYSASFRALQNNQPNSSAFDLGGSLFYSKNDTSMVVTSTWVKNFISKTESSTSTDIGVYFNAGKGSDFISLAENGAIALRTKSNVYLSHFRLKSTTGIGLYVGSDSEGSISNFYSESTTGDAVYIYITDGRLNKILSNFEARATTGHALANAGMGQISNATLINDGSNETCDIAGTFDMYNCTIINKGSGECIDNNSGDFRAFNCVLRSVGGICATIASSSVSTDVSYSNCNFVSLYDDASGHCVNITSSTGGVEFANCSFEVVNASANCLYASASRTIKASNNTMIGATTAINANVTIAASTDLGNGNRSY